MALIKAEFYSSVLDLWMKMEVLLPQPVRNQEDHGQALDPDGGRGLKTMYLLHGMGGDETVWERKTLIERYVEKLNIAVVIPSAHLSYYTDTTYGMNYWTYISEELPFVCRSLFPQLSARREDTLAAGMSMGGYGAWKLGLGAPQTFGAAASLSGVLDIVGEYRRAMQDNRERMPLYRGIFGTENELEHSDNNLLQLSSRLAASGGQKPRLYAWCGTEDFLYGGNRRAWEHFEKLGYDLTVSESEGDHLWSCWDEQICPVLKWWLGSSGNACA